MGDITIVNTPTPNIKPTYTNFPQGRQNNPIFQFDIDPAGNNINFKSLSILVSGNIDTANISFDVWQYTGTPGSGSWGSLKGTQSNFKEGLSTLNVTYSPSGYSFSTLTSFYLAINVSPTYNLSLTSFKVSINSATILDSSSNPLTVNIFTGQLPIIISGIQSDFTYSRYMVVTADGTIYPIALMDFQPINNYDPTLFPELALSVLSNQPSLAQMGNLILWDNDFPDTTRVTQNIAANMFISFPTNWTTGITSSYTLAWALSPNVGQGTSINVALNSISLQTTLPLSLYYALPSTDVVAGTGTILINSSNLVVLVDATTTNYWLPQGSQKNILFRFAIGKQGTATYDTVVLESLVLDFAKNVNPEHIRLKLYRDINNDGTMIDEQQYAFSMSPVIDGRTSLNNLNQLLSGIGTTINYILAADIAPTTNVGEVQFIVTINSLSARIRLGTSYADCPVFLTANAGGKLAIGPDITGLQANFIATSDLLFFNQGTAIRVLTINCQPLFENTKHFLLSMDIQSNEPNLVGYWSMVLDTQPANTTTINSTAGVLSLSLPTADLEVNITHQIFIDFTPDITMQSGITLHISALNCQGIGIKSGLPLHVLSILPSRDIKFAGLKLTPTAISVDTTVIGGMEVPLYGWTAQSYFTTSTLNKIQIDNAGNLPFANTYSQNKIDAVRVFQDINSNNIWDPQDRAVTSAVYPSYTQVVSSPTPSIYLFLNEPIGQYTGYGTNKTYFLTYTTGGSAEGSATARLTNADYTDGLINGSHNLGGPLASSPTGNFTTGVANFKWVTTNQLITQSVMGATGLPVLRFTLFRTPRGTSASLNLTLSNNLSLFTGNDSGIKRVSLVEDMNNNGRWDIGDVLQEESTVFSSPSQINLRISNVPTIGNNHYYYLFIDVGQSIPDGLVLSDVLNLSFSKETASTSSGNVSGNTGASNATIAGIFPQPRFDTQIQIQTTNLIVSLISVSPSMVVNTQDPRIWLSYQVDNPFAITVTITDLSPQFYQTKISSRNVTNEFRFTTLNLPVLLGPGQSVTFDIVATPHLTVEQGSLYIDAALSYVWSGQNVLLTRRLQQNWSSMASASGNRTTQILIPTYNIFYLENPNYIQKLERESLGITDNFRNGEIINEGDALIIWLTEAGQGIDLSKTTLRYNNVTLNAISDQNNTHYSQDRKNGTLWVGPLYGPKGSITLLPQDIAGNALPQANITYKTNTSLFIQDFLPYPSLAHGANLINTPLQIGFLLSRGPTDVTAYIFNSLGQLIWKNQVNYPRFGYQMMTFNGTMLDGNFIPRGLYLIKLLAKEIGSGNQASALTKFIVD